MKGLDENIGKIYHEKGFYYLEKVYEDLVELIDDESRVKRRAKKHGFKVMQSNWHLGKNPNHAIETIINSGNIKHIDKSRYIYKMKLKYLK